MQSDKNDKQPGRAQGSFSFSFGLRRYVAFGPRRLFTTHKQALAPVHDGALKKPRAILRVVSDYAG